LAAVRAVAVIAFLPALIFMAFASSISLPQLPPDESGLGVLLEEQAIDTFQYEQLLVFYALPLSVPQGELALLAQVFPDIENMLPTLEQIEAYQPFDNRQIRNLLNDFPILSDFEPILRFNVSISEQGANGEIIFGINRSPIDELRGHRVRFRFKTPNISAEGNVAFSDTAAMWQNRRVDVAHSGVNVQIGNFKQPIPGELFFGRFSSTAITDGGDPVAANWLYGGSNTWNGASVNAEKIPGAPMLGASAFYHVRGDERGAGGGINLRVNRRIRVHAGITGFVDIASNTDNINNTDDDDYDYYDDDVYGNIGGIGIVEDYLYTAHLYGEYRERAWRTVVETGLPLGQESIAPALSARVSYRIRESSAEYHFISYPSDFNAPMSSVKRRLLSEVGEKESSLSPSIQKHRLRMSVPLSIPSISVVRLTPEVDFTEHQGMIRRVYGRADIRARVKSADIALRHSARIFTAEPDSVLYVSRASVNLQTGYPVEIRATGQSAYGYYENSRNTYTFELIYTGLPNAVIAPFARGRYVTDHEYWFGVKTELHLYRKTWTGITVEIPVGVERNDNVYIRGSSSYSF
jgi:hypothetical protein